MGVQALAHQAREHWAEWLPSRTAELEKQGRFSMETLKAAQRAQAQIRRLMQQGYQAHEAEEVALREHILLPPEEGVDGLDEELRAELEEMEKDYLENVVPFLEVTGL
jgi:hypothetical protein